MGGGLTGPPQPRSGVSRVHLTYFAECPASKQTHLDSGGGTHWVHHLLQFLQPVHFRMRNRFQKRAGGGPGAHRVGQGSLHLPTLPHRTASPLTLEPHFPVRNCALMTHHNCILWICNGASHRTGIPHLSDSRNGKLERGWMLRSKREVVPKAGP